MYHIEVILIDNAVGRPMGPEFETPEDVIKFINGLDRTGLKHFEINQYDPDGQLVESVSYDDFVSFQSDIELGRLLKQFDECMEEFKALADKTIEALHEISEEAIKRLDESTQKAIAEIKQAGSPDIEFGTGQEITDLRQSIEIWHNQVE